VINRSTNLSYYRARAVDCENAAYDQATTATDQAILLHCAARWYRMANEPSPPIPEGRYGESCGASERS
jgi:hypothetical protein